MKKTIHSTRSGILSTRFKNLRIQAKLTQRELAQRLDVPYGTVSRIELGDRRVDIIEYLDILKTLNIEPQKEFSQLIELFNKST